jgi:hypothetical protein
MYVTQLPTPSSRGIRGQRGHFGANPSRQSPSPAHAKARRQTREAHSPTAPPTRHARARLFNHTCPRLQRGAGGRRTRGAGAPPGTPRRGEPRRRTRALRPRPRASSRATAATRPAPHRARHLPPPAAHAPATRAGRADAPTCAAGTDAPQQARPAHARPAPASSRTTVAARHQRPPSRPGRPSSAPTRAPGPIRRALTVACTSPLRARTWAGDAR